MKNLKLIPMLLLMMSFMSCVEVEKKPKPKTIDDVSKTFDITKYVIVGKQYFGSETRPFIIKLNANGLARSEGTSSFEPYIYTYKNGILTLDQMGGNLIRVRINRDTITSFETTIQKFESYQLIKIPSENKLVGNSFGGIWKMIVAGQWAPHLSAIKFTNTQYDEAMLHTPTPNKAYKLYYNLAAKTVNDNTKDETLWVLINGKLEGFRYNPKGKKLYTGTFIRN